MGVVHVVVEVSRHGGPRTKVRFLLDSGLQYSVLPSDVWHRLGLEAKRELEFSLADGTTLHRRLSECSFRYRGLGTVGPVVLGEGDDVAILGTVTLASMALMLNPFDRTLVPMRLTLAGVRPRAGRAPMAC